MEEPVVADTRPARVELETSKNYFWCACGRSANQPFCDSSHKDTGFTPKRFSPEKDGPAFLCQCKRTSTPPYCDGTHKRVKEEMGG